MTTPESALDYDHKQHGRMHYLLYGVAVMMAIVGAAMRSQPDMMRLALVIAATLVVVNVTFHWLRVVGEANRLVVRFGPLPLMRRNIPYADILEVQPARSRVLDGWGIHWGPGGWIWNIWGFDCVALTMTRGRKLRIGTDEPEKLAEFLRSKIARGPDVPA